MNDWQPMETARLDGTQILVMFLGERVIARWHDEYECWVGLDVKWYGGFQSHTVLRDRRGKGPDCWQPLPALSAVSAPSMGGGE